jgi:hypothetical protein
MNIDLDKVFGELGFDHRSFMAVRPVRTEEDAVRVEVELKDAVKRRFRELALMAHPDKGGDPERFKRISAAHDFVQKQVRVRPPRRLEPIRFVFQDITIDMSDMDEMLKGWSFCGFGVSNYTATTATFYGGMHS